MYQPVKAHLLIKLWHLPMAISKEFFIRDKIEVMYKFLLKAGMPGILVPNFFSLFSRWTNHVGLKNFHGVSPMSSMHAITIPLSLT